VIRPHVSDRTRKSELEPTMASYVLLTLVVALVIYLFYAVIHPERF